MKDLFTGSNIRLLSFHEPLEGIKRAEGLRNILWPCLCYSISIPCSRRQGLNIFEKTVLKMLPYTTGSEELLADTLCLEKDLVLFILDRLHQYGFIDKHNSLTSLGTQMLSLWGTPSSDTEYTTGIVLMDLVTGRLLHFFSDERLTYAKVMPCSHGKLKFRRDETSNWRNGDVISPSVEAPQPPSPAQIVRAIRGYADNLHKIASLRRKNVSLPKVPKAEAITIGDPQPMLLHRRAFILSASGELAVTDGFGTKFSSSAAQHLLSCRWKGLEKLRQEGVIEDIGGIPKSEASVPKRPSPYRRVHSLMDDARKALLTVQTTVVASTTDEKNVISAKGNCLSLQYDALEWGLSYAIAHYPVPQWACDIAADVSFNSRLLYGIAEDLGFILSEQHRPLFAVKSGAISHMDSQKPEMLPLIAMLLLGSRKHTDHPAAWLAEKHPSLFEFIAWLKERRNSWKHADHAAVKAFNAEILAESLRKTEAIIQCLLPDIEFEQAETTTVNTLEKDQKYLKARLQLEQALGNMPLDHHFSTPLKEALENIFLQKKGSSAFILECSKGLELCLEEILERQALDVRRGEPLKEKALDKLIKAGFFPVNGIPAPLRGIEDKKLRQAIGGGRAALSGKLLALAFVAFEDQLDDLKAAAPAFMETAMLVHKLRGHGNNSGDDELTEEQADALIKELFTVIRALKEIF